MTTNPQVAVIVSQQIELGEITELAGCNDQQFSDIINLCFSEYAPQQTSVELCLMNEKEHCAAHQRFLNDPSATDVMAFPYDDDDCCDSVDDDTCGHDDTCCHEESPVLVAAPSRTGN